jgi:ATP-dependent Clp protease adaptor protein ClpS
MTHTQEDTLLEAEINKTTEKTGSLIIWNDDVNTFDWVIETLIAVCGHSAEQAEQCALLVHHLGKYSVKNGSVKILRSQCDAITDRGIQATVEITA